MKKIVLLLVLVGSLTVMASMKSHDPDGGIVASMKSHDPGGGIVSIK